MSSFRVVELRDTETAHRDALGELETMREAMEKMEEERAAMIAEVEAQIERALASMAVDIEESDGESRPSSRMSSRSAPSALRRPSEGRAARPLRSFSTDSTLAESYEVGMDGGPGKTETVLEVPEEDGSGDGDGESTPAKKKRFSAALLDLPQDGMTAVDEGISQKSDKIALKVSQIQRKVRVCFVCRAGSASTRSGSPYPRRP